MASGIHAMSNVSNVVNCLVNAGKTFVGRYYAVLNASKSLTLAEAQAISAAGLYIVSIWQESADYAGYFTFSRGRSDGLNAFSKAANDLSQTGNTPIYFAVDFDATSADQQAVLDYFSGVRQGYNDYLQQQRQYGEPQTPYRIGVYGSYDVLSWCQTQGIAIYSVSGG